MSVALEGEMEKMTKTILAMILLLLCEVIPIPAFADDPTSRVDSAKIELPSEKLIGLWRGEDISINTFKVTPAKLTAGQQAELIWEVSGATQVFIDNNTDLNRTEVSPVGHLKITPLKTTDYILTAFGWHMIGTSAVAKVDVHGQPPIPTITLSADPINILVGEKVTLTWETRFADTIAIDNGIGTVGSRGTIEIEPRVTTTYTLAATGLGGGKIANITITVMNSQAVSLLSK